ncbi:hypothetical protein ACH5RR_001279 [Cinchona calisaya]|uniref:Fe2OG dioxygenase domain-containing protein n=1 Tax=Cinchona calisaya TaxID=153742 RepID=A0ABD3B3L8_9GENT
MEINDQIFVLQTKQKNSIPVIDFTKQSLNPGTSSWISTCKAVREAMEEYGCFIAFDNKVDFELRSAVFGFLEELFDLPVEKKMLNTSNIPFFGYIGKMPNADQLYESMGIEDSTTIDAVQSFANLMWPSGNNQFCESMHSYINQVSQLGDMMTRMLFESYGVENYYDSHVKSSSYLLRPNGYKVPKDNEANILGAIPHTDASFLTVLQQNEAPGLEIKSKDGTWISVDFPPSSFVVMAGDALLAWSNGRISPCLHRVTITGKISRYSVGLFSYHNGIVEVPKELADEKYPLKFKPFDHLGYYRFVVPNLALSVEERLKAFCGLQDDIA